MFVTLNVIVWGHSCLRLFESGCSLIIGKLPMDYLFIFFFSENVLNIISLQHDIISLQHDLLQFLRILNKSTAISHLIENFYGMRP